METASENLHSLYKQLGDLRGDFRNYNLYRFIRQRLYGKSILDIGCGAGHFLNVASKAGFITHGIEDNKELITLSKAIYQKDLGIKQGRVENLKNDLHIYDSIVLIDVLEHLEDDEGALQMLHNKLNKNGRLIILVPAYNLLYGKRDRSIGHFRRYTKKGLIRKLKNSGFEIYESRYWNMLGVAPYFVAEKILKKEFIVGFRDAKKKGMLSKGLNRVLFSWFRLIENNVNAGFGLSVLVVAKKK